MALNPSLAGAIHDLQARLGSIRIAVSAVAGLDLDAETRTEMLTSASEESVRASAELVGVGALTACALDTSASERCDVAAVVTEAADTARLAGLRIEARVDGPAIVEGHMARLHVALPALVRLVAGAGKDVDASVTSDATEVRIHLERTGDEADREQLPPIVDYLIAEIGAARLDEGAGLTFSLPRADA